ncbi:MAG: hypothetical protein CMI26_11665 [Opitutae bacterium]|nr:hypothetical protein [Opitutae bacterium]
MKNFPPAFLTAAALSLAGFANLGFAERYETVIVKTDDTASMNNAAAVAYLKSNACISTQSIEIPTGEVAYVFASGAVARPNATSQHTYNPSVAFLPSILVDVDGLDSNQTINSGWDIHSSNWNISTGTSPACSNISSGVQPVAGPASIRIQIKPESGRATNFGGNYWSRSDAGNWDFKASEAYVTFRIVGSEKEVSKKFATVIPENAPGNVSIILEQSTDLINWTAVNPGSFPPSTAKRFFRVRSQE